MAEIVVTIIVVWPGGQPLAVPPTGWRKVGELEDGAILCSYAGDWAIGESHPQPWRVVGHIIEPLIEEAPPTKEDPRP